MGAIIYWGLIRFAIVLVGSWILYPYITDYSSWWGIFFVGVSVIVIYPAQIGWRQHRAQMRRASENQLCVKCRNYNEENILCTVLDQHVTRTRTPCEGALWEPIQIDLS